VKFKEGMGFLSENLDQMLEKREWRTQSHSFDDLLDTPVKNINFYIGSTFKLIEDYDEQKSVFDIGFFYFYAADINSIF